MQAILLTRHDKSGSFHFIGQKDINQFCISQRSYHFFVLVSLSLAELLINVIYKPLIDAHTTHLCESHVFNFLDPLL